MQRYMYEHAVPLDAFAGFSINAHRNGANNPNAMFQEAIGLKEYVNAPLIATPINMMDSSPVCDGSAALVLVPTEWAHEFTTGHHRGRAVWPAPAPTTWPCTTPGSAVCGQRIRWQRCTGKRAWPPTWTSSNCTTPLRRAR
jgi:acetyl-CoA acetyltransferase